jgi:MFS family permease
LLVYIAVSLSLLQGVSMRGAKMLVSLSALEIGATPFQVGLLAALFAAFPLVLAVYAGKISDRIGVTKPIVGGSLMLALGLLVPLAGSGLAGLMACSALVGLGHIFFHVSIHNLIGAYGGGEARTRNFATFALGASDLRLHRPVARGLLDRRLGFRPTHWLLAGVALMPAIIILAYPTLVPARTPRAPRRSPAARWRCCATRACGARSS